jgi:GGDEF domain-containing protein
MLWYVAFVAAFNLAMGYAWGAYIRKCPRCAKARAMGVSLLEPNSLHISAPPRFDAPPVAPMPTFELPPALADSPAADAPSEMPAEAMAEADVIDPATGLVTRESAERLLSDLADGKSPSSPVTAGLVEMAPLDWIGAEPNGSIEERMLSGVSKIVRQSLSAEHTLAKFNDQQFLVLVPSEDVGQVTRRAEELRQRVATTEFVADGHTYQTTVTCALVDAATFGTGPKLFEFLQEALDEAKRYGGNRTFMHDGKSPTPVVPAELAIAPQQLAI